jgi:uncharacterized membrane-anchored protein YhcB (DUF1043 family)
MAIAFVFGVIFGAGGLRLAELILKHQREKKK